MSPDAPKKILDLVERFQRNLREYHSSAYNEMQLRREFVDPLFKALEWDVDNEGGAGEAYKDVVHEHSLKIGGETKAPDYCFRYGGTPKFFVETKKPAVNLKDDPSPAFQLRRYAWSAGLPLSVLTDFEEFAVYDCRVKPHKDDKAGTARIAYFTFDQYPQQWSEIASVFSKDAIYKGDFDRYIESTKKKRGTSEVDDSFLKEIENWRDVLAHNIALRNKRLTSRQMNFAVQRTIDRIIFLRVCEDRGIEEYGRLRDLPKGKGIYSRLYKLFEEADEKYNSGLFHFRAEKNREHPDELSRSLKIDDDKLKQIIRGLYYPDSPYEFSVLPADILGQVYEQFLGKVIRLTPSHQAKVETKPEVKKAGGVYYTPTYIVEYIVEHTVGKLLEGKTPRQAAKLHILDPACGSGSFLIGAYQYLLDWHLKYYTSHTPSRHKDKVFQMRKGEWRLTMAERKRILLNNIYGVDIDPQAVEVTKLSLLLKVLEGESRDRIESQLKLYRERALPDLGRNIKCGNSLIGPDFYNELELDLDDEERYRINVFDWQDEFSEIMKAGGFDAVIGNPPYVRQEVLGPQFKNYAAQHYKAYAGTADLYVYFIERSHTLLRHGGRFGMICSNKFMRTNYGKALRDYLVQYTRLIEIADFGELKVFQGASPFPAIILTTNDTVPAQEFTYAPVKRLDFNSLEKEVAAIAKTLNQKSVEGEYWSLAGRDEIRIMEKMKRVGTQLSNFINRDINYGIKTGLNDAFIIDSETRKRLIKEDAKSAELIKPFVNGDDIRKYRINYKGKYLLLIPSGLNRLKLRGKGTPWSRFQQHYPAVATHLEQFKARAEKRWDKGEYWWELRACAYYADFEKPKIVYPDIAKESRFTYDDNGLHLANTIYFFPSNDMYLLGLLNSKLIFHYYKRHSAVLGDADKKGRLRFFTQDFEKIPIRTIKYSNKKDKSCHDKMVKLVKRMLDLNKKLPEVKTEDEQVRIERQIKSTDRQIDALVYELYGLTEAEIKIVEEAA